MSNFASSTIDSFKALFRPGIQGLRAFPVYTEHLRQTRDNPLAIFLPAYGPGGAALLRIHTIATALRKHGWRTLVLPPALTLDQRRRFLSRMCPDVLVMQGARHELNRPSLYPEIPTVFDMDDADFHLPHLSFPVRDAMEHVSAVAAGSRYIANWCLDAGAPRAEVIWTGAPVSAGPFPPQAGRAPIIAWAQTRPQTYLREAEMVRKVSAAIAARHPGTTLRLYDRMPDDDPSFARTFDAPGLTVNWTRAAGYDDFLASFDDVALGLAPLCPEAPFSRGKSFGKVLAYLDRNVPVLASDAGEHGAFFRAGLGVLSNDPAVWIDEAVRLLKNDGARSEMAGMARLAFVRRLSTEAATARMDRLLRQVAGRGGQVSQASPVRAAAIAGSPAKMS